MNSATTLRTIALKHPAAIPVFEHFELDYCCGGKRPLGEACAEKCIAAEVVLAALNEAVHRQPAEEESLTGVTAAELIRHIVKTHHGYIRNELPRLRSMANRVAQKHGPIHPEATFIQRNLTQLAEELLFHLDKEERILFPYIEGLERSHEKHAAPPSACFGSVESPIRQMIAEHEGAAGLLEEMRMATRGFVPWAGACPTTGGLYYELKAFEADLHRHVHLENNLLFPRAIALEQEALTAQ
jgi:regulator of cell morphogenesis and NO signaling